MLNQIKRIIDNFKHETDQELHDKLEAESLARRKRNEQRIEQIKTEMGDKWVLHPSHKKSRLDEPRPV
jgi:hypothetical protein